MKLKHLESYLEDVEVFDTPNIALEQYPTTPHLAAHMIYTIENCFGEIQGKAIGDLGSGCGMLSIAACMLGSSYNVAYEIDPNAIEIARRNFEAFEVDVDIVNIDIASLFGMNTCYEAISKDDEKEDSSEEGSEESSEEEEEEEEEEDERAENNKRRGGRGERGGRGRGRGGRGRGRGGRGRGGRGRGGRGRGGRGRGRGRGGKGKGKGKRENDEEYSGREERHTLKVEDLSTLSHPHPPKLLDTIIMNPPFGTRNAGIDMVFIRAAMNLCTTSIYSLHKTSTREYILKKARDWGMGVKVIAEMKFDIPKMYEFHKHKSVDVYVDLIRFDLKDPTYS